MKLLKRIVNFFRALFSPREEGSPHKKVGYIVDQLKIVVDTVENYKLTYAIVNIDTFSQEEIEEIKKELDKRKYISYVIDEEKRTVKLYCLK